MTEAFEYEEKYLPREVALPNGQTFTLDRRLTKGLPVSRNRNRVTYVFVRDPQSDKPNSRGTAYYVGDTQDMGHTSLFELTKETLQVKGVPFAGGIFMLHNNQAIHDRQSDVMGGADIDLRNGLRQALEEEYFKR